MINLTAPAFWFRPETPQATLLAPLAWVWGRVTQWRLRRGRPYFAGIPVICIGNTVVGGTGKTPLAIALFTHIKDSGIANNPCFLTRGYRGRVAGAALVQRHSNAAKFGDEALLLAQTGPTLAARDRVSGLQLARNLGHDLVIVDDGFQNPDFYKDVSILVFDGTRGIGNGLCLPAGPNREALADGLKRAHAAMIVGPDATGLREALTHIPVFSAGFKAAYNKGDAPYVAFAGIGNPDKFYDTLRASNFNVVATRNFPDHHVYSGADLKMLEAEAVKLNAKLITTEKDFVKLPHDARAYITALPVTLKVDGLAELATLIRTKLGRA